MDDRRTVLSKIARQKAAIDELVSQTRDIVSRSVILLRAPTPDVFLGRKVQEPSPKENEAKQPATQRGPSLSCHADSMNDPLFSRARLAIEESRELQRQSRAVKTQHDDMRHTLRCTVFESKMHRSEIIAHREDRANHNNGE